jgi:hypothetical protein
LWQCPIPENLKPKNRVGAKHLGDNLRRKTRNWVFKCFALLQDATRFQEIWVRIASSRKSLRAIS